MMIDEVVISLQEELAQLARDMVRLELWAREARERRRFDREAELLQQRELVADRRYQLTRERLR